MDIQNSTNVTQSGVITWKSNGNVLPEECVKEAIAIGIPVNLLNCRAAREKQVAVQIAAYKERMKDYTPSAEDLYEMRSAFGPGTTVVNVLTGQTYEV